MLGLKADAYDINNSGDGQYAFFADIGTRALQSVRVGEGAGKISQGNANTFIGYETGKENRAGSFGVFVGFQAGQLNQAGNLNTFVGAYAGRENNRGDRNTFVGYQAGAVNRDGDECTGVGAFALRENTTGNRNVAVGNRAGERILDGDANTMIGVEAGQDIRSGTNNTMSGFRSGRGSFKGNENTYFGAFSGYSNSLGDGNAFVGFKAGEYLTLGNYNVAIGAYALQKATSGSCNIAIGAFAGSILTGDGNVFVGTGAGSSNLAGNNNTNIGNNAGFEGNGSDNVYVGKNAAYSLDGDQNVVIGVGAMPDMQSTGSVVIGYKSADAIFQRGNCNVFIGVGADAFIPDTSYAIAIGPNQTRAYTHSISIGEELITAGVNALSLGYQITTESDQCVGLGNSITVSSAEVFNDPLNFQFPVNLTEAYDTFYLTEDYTNTLFLNNTSNTQAIATIDNSNLFDSGNNTLKGTTQTQDIDLRNLFSYGLFFQGTTLYPPSTITQEDYLKANLVANFDKNLLTIESTGPYDSVTNLSAPTLRIPFNGTSLTFLTNVNCNLIPNDTNRFLFTIATPKRQSLYQIDTSNSTTIIRPTQPDEVTAEAQLADFTYYNHLYAPPTFGFIDSNLQYHPYPETLFSSNDRYILATVNQLTNTHPDDSNVYGLVSDTLYHQEYIRYPTPLIKHNTKVFLHPQVTKRFDQSYFFYLPASNLSHFTLHSLDSNLVLSSSNYYDFPTLTIPNPSSNMTAPLRLDAKNTTYDFYLDYNCNISTYTRSNLTLTILPFSLSNYTIPLIPTSNTQVYSYPLYGNLTLTPTTITYTPTQINFGQETFTLLLQETPYRHTYYDILVTTSNLYRAVPSLHKMQEPAQVTLTEETLAYSAPQVQSNLLFTTLTNTLLVTTQGTQIPVNLPTPFSTSNTQVYTVPYLPQGYIQTSNTIGYFKYENIPTTDPRYTAFFSTYPLPNQLSNDQGVDYIRYHPTLPYVNFSFYNSNNPTPYSQYQTPLTTALDERYFNTNGFNRYFLFDKSYSNDTYYFTACNLTILNSNLTITFDTYYDRYNHFIYIRESSNQTNLATSNYQPMQPTNDPRTATLTTFVTTTQRYNSNIPTVQLQDTLLYHYNSSYQVRRPLTPNKLLFLQKDIGPVNQFHQSNITNQEIHLWNRDPNITLVETETAYFVGKQIDIKYYQYPNEANTVTAINSATYINQVPTAPYNIVADGEFIRIAIQHTCNVSFRTTTNLPLTEYLAGTTIFTVPGLGYSNDAFVDYIALIQNVPINIDNIKRSRRITIPTFYRKNKPLAYNLAPLNQPIRTLTSNEIFHSPEETYQVTTLNQASLFLNNTLLNPLDTFTQADINANRITYSAPTHTTFTLTTNTPATYILNTYAAPEFPPSPTTGCNVLLQTRDSYQHYLLGNLWDYVRNTTQNLILKVLQQPSQGFLATSNGDVVQEISYQTLTDPTTRIYYIPFNCNVPTSLSNDTCTVCLDYNSNLSVPYQLQIKNYWSRWSNVDIFVNNPVFYQAPSESTYYTSNLPRSTGMLTDNLSWSPPTFTLPYNTSNTVSLSLNYLNHTQSTDIRTRPLTQQPTFTTSSNLLTVDNTSYLYLTSVLSQTNGDFFYITQAPTQGVILTQLTPNQFQALPYFTRADILTNKVFYHHYGVDLSISPLLNDLFLLKTSTTPFDLSRATLSNIITLSEAPKLLTNDYDYIFYPNLQQGSNSYNPLTTDKLQIDKGFLLAYERSNLDLFLQTNSNTYQPTTIVTEEALRTNKVFYRPSSNLFTGPAGFNKNEAMSMRFSLSSNINNFEANPLSVYPQYQNLFSQTWFSKFNTYESVNVIQSDINSNQSISYTRFVNTTSNLSFANKKCEIEFEYLPYQTDLVNPTYIDFIQTYYYSFTLLDTSNQPLFTADFTHSNITITTSNHPPFNLPPVAPFDSTTWTKFSMVNFDSLNNNNLSLYFNDTNVTYNQPISSLDLTPLKQIKITVPIYHPLNYYNVTQTSNIALQTNVYYNLVNYNTQLRFRNFNIFLATTEVDANVQAGAADPNVYNIAVGNKLDVRGINNICLGQDFRTTGKNSIILGSSIGVQQGAEVVLNEIFNSIVISNNSFTNSKVRDVIAIGNNILNDITGNIEDFLSKKPVLVGNNIDSTKIDFHVNFQNTFLKTTVPTPQIYCGLESEHVCIGYTSNEQIDNAKRLHVKGGAEVFGPWEIINGGQRLLRTVVGNLLFTTGTSHSYSMVLSWANPQSTDYNAFSLAGKFRVVNNDTSYAYRRFEVFITPKNDSLNNKPSALSDLEIASFSTTDITGLDHSIVRVNATTIQLVVSWNTADNLSVVDYYGQGTLELEVSAPVALGEISIV